MISENRKYLGGCQSARRHFNIPDSIQCCISCHDDDDYYGYEMCELATEDNGWFNVCCTIATCEYVTFIQEDSNGKEETKSTP